MDVGQLDATAQADLVRQKEIKPIELLEATIERIERVNPRINAVITKTYDEALQIVSGSIPDGPFAGVPFLLKDSLIEYAGVRHTEGSEFLGDYVSDHDSELVVRYKRAGLIVLGKTNTCEMAVSPTTEPRRFGATRNPWDITRMPGGSSGGSAAAVACGMVPMAHGNDGGGSIRVPASCCGVFGLKPTRGRNPLGPLYGDFWNGMVVAHAITRSVRDSAALLDATSGPDAGDPYWAPTAARPFLEEVGADPGRLRIAFSAAASTGLPVHSDCVAAVRSAAALCTELGHIVEEAAPAVMAMDRSGLALSASGCAWCIDAWASRMGRTATAEMFEPYTWAQAEMGRSLSAPSYLMALQESQKMSRDMARFFHKYDVWLTPTLAEPPLPLGTFDAPAENPLAPMFRTATFMPFTPVCNITGQPAMSVPLHWNDDLLPIGTQFVGSFGDEATLFRLAAQLEAARPWAQRFPHLGG